MTKKSINFWIDIAIFIVFILVVFTGIVLREFSADLSGYTVLGVPRKELADLHWVLALSMIICIFAHLVLHWGWAKASFKKQLRVGPKTLAITAIALILVSMIIAPVYLTRDLPGKKALKPASSEAEPPWETAAPFEECRFHETEKEGCFGPSQIIPY